MVMESNNQRFTVAKTGTLIALTRTPAILPPILNDQNGDPKEEDEDEEEENNAGKGPVICYNGEMGDLFIYICLIHKALSFSTTCQFSGHLCGVTRNFQNGYKI